jgi:hypothetical protein
MRRFVLAANFETTMKTPKTPTLYIRKKTQMILKGRMLKGILTLQAKLGARGTWNIAGENGSIYDFASEEDRDAKIAELVRDGAIIK